MGAKYALVFFLINETKFDRVMTLSPHKGMDLAKMCISKMVYWFSFCFKINRVTQGFYLERSSDITLDKTCS